MWALEQSIDRGYAVASFYNGDVEPDQPDGSAGVLRVAAAPTAAAGIVSEAFRVFREGLLSPGAIFVHGGLHFLGADVPPIQGIVIEEQHELRHTLFPFTGVTNGSRENRHSGGFFFDGADHYPATNSSVCLRQFGVFDLGGATGDG